MMVESVDVIREGSAIIGALVGGLDGALEALENASLSCPGLESVSFNIDKSSSIVVIILRCLY